MTSCRTLKSEDKSSLLYANNLLFIRPHAALLVPCVFVRICKETPEIGVEDCWISGNWRSSRPRRAVKTSVLRRCGMRLLLTLLECQEGSGTRYPLYPRCWIWVTILQYYTVREKGLFSEYQNVKICPQRGESHILFLKWNILFQHSIFIWNIWENERVESWKQNKKNCQIYFCFNIWYLTPLPMLQTS